MMIERDADGRQRAHRPSHLFSLSEKCLGILDCYRVAAQSSIESVESRAKVAAREDKGSDFSLNLKMAFSDSATRTRPQLISSLKLEGQSHDTA